MSGSGEAMISRRVRSFSNSRHERVCIRAGRALASLVLALVGIVGALGTSQPVAAYQSVAPAYTHSWYIDSVDVGAIQSLGQVDGQWDGAGNHCGFGDNSSQDKIVVLDFGKDLKLYDDNHAYRGYGTQIFTNNSDYLTDDDIAYRVEQYAAQYFWNSGGPGGCAQTRIAIGTNNSFLCESSLYPCNAYDAGWEWSNVVSNVNNWLQGQGFSGRIGARAADDIETFGYTPQEGFHCAGDTTDFMNGFADNPGGNATLDFGDAITSSGCWTLDQVRYVTTGRPNFYGLPEVYNACQLGHYTDGCAGYAGVESATGAIELKGQMTECGQADVVPQYDCGSSDYGPRQSWEALWAKQQLYFGPGGQPSGMPFSTNIKRQ